MPQELLQLDALTIAFRGAEGDRAVVDRADLRIHAGETVALVGESGSGKSLLARAIVGLLPGGARVTGGRLVVKGRPFPLDNPAELRVLRGRTVSYIFQEPLSSLNPALKVGTQLTEGLRFHTTLARNRCHRRALELLERVRIDEPRLVMEKYPHELSGGMRQRVMIATSLMLEPALLVADEPTTALDVVVQQQVLLLMQQLAAEMGTAILLITHDMSVVAMVADTVTVMQRGSTVEQGPVADILGSAHHPYTRELLAAALQPRTDEAERPVHTVGKQPPILQVRNLSVAFSRERGPATNVLEHVSFSVAPAETLGIVGESGSGKTTLSRAIAGLQAPSSGGIWFRGERLDRGGQRRQGLQLIFQDPVGSLDPRMRVGDIVAEGLLFRAQWTAAERRQKAAQALEAVNLGSRFLDRKPHQLSGGQRQRVSIARAIVTDPDIVLADEPVSALDLTVQEQILELFLALKQRIRFACLFISHDLDVVERIADRVGVLYRGVLVEIGPREAIFNRPQHPYTRTLLAATSHLVPAQETGYRLSGPDAAHPRACDSEPLPRSAPIRYRQVDEAGHLVALSD
ncbi:MAG TPA: ABC transporter ATP-binding protein [Woeseiaceae bacterium]|nr:ABC transporter ATP-binding protein [Woeseiaceae bacterium]